MEKRCFKNLTRLIGVYKVFLSVCCGNVELIIAIYSLLFLILNVKSY